MGFSVLLLLLWLLLCVSLSHRQPTYTTQCATDDSPSVGCFHGCFEKCRSSSSQQANRLKFTLLCLFLFSHSISLSLFRSVSRSPRGRKGEVT
uniref:Putative secreted protein n=1 Tax=Anopheles marajoara TaxID=58244 RepID=A0A2M4C9N4_9DIPT